MELQVRKANIPEDLNQIHPWMSDWKVAQAPEWWYPADNYIIDGVIFASYYKTNGKIALIENVVSNPTVPHETRRIALGIIGEYIFARAKEDGFKMVMAWTTNKSVWENSKEHDMKVSDYNYAIVAKTFGDE